MKKKIAFALALAFLMLLTLAACGPSNTDAPKTSGGPTQSGAPASSKITIKISTSQLPTQQMGNINKYSLITPPVGTNIYVLSSVGKMPVQSVIKGLIPFVAILLVGLVIVSFVPWFSTCLL